MRLSVALVLAFATAATAAAEGITKAPELVTSRIIKIETFAKGLENPWGMDFLPDGRLLLTERPGRMRIVGRDGKLSDPLQGVPAVYTSEQGGLFDVVLSPNFATSGLIYFCYAEARGKERNTTTVARAKLVPRGEGGLLTGVEVIFRQEPPYASPFQFGSRLLFMPDGSLFVTLGDRDTARDQAQDPAGHIGKLVRLLPDGRPYPGNPRSEGWRPEIWSIGHRNMQGIALQPGTGRVWTVEHGPRGGDELNAPRAGKNYGWPVITYGRDYDLSKIGEGTEKAGMEQPVYYWDPSIAPSSVTFYEGALFPEWKGNLLVSALIGKALHRLVLDGETVVGEEVLLEEFNERFREVRSGPDGAIWILTDSPEGEVLRVVPVEASGCSTEEEFFIPPKPSC
jgi:glucose/arabinose dehydrogenase